MNFDDEAYIRLYTRDTVGWLRLGWQAQSLFCLLLRKVDRTGCLEAAPDVAGAVEAISAILRMPEDVAAPALQKLLDAKVVEITGAAIVIPKFVEAQSAVKTAKERQRESRIRKRDLLRAGIDASVPDGAVIYFVQSEQGGAIKVGRAEDLARRLVNLGSSRPDKLVVLAAFQGTRADEREVQSLLTAYRDRGEWFRPTAEVMQCVNYASQHGPEVLKWMRSQPCFASQIVTQPELPFDPTPLLTSQKTSPGQPIETVPLVSRAVTQVVTHNKHVTLSLAQPSLADHKSPLPPAPRDAVLDSLTGKAPGHRQDVQKLHSTWKQIFGYRNAVFRGPFDLDAETLARAIDAHGFEDCLLVLRAASSDTWVTGEADDHGERHDSIRYIFDNKAAFDRILRAAQGGLPRAQHRDAIDVLREMRDAEPDLSTYNPPEPEVA